jgi:hypothetical protein
MTETSSRTNWLDVLSEEDLVFVKRFIVASGSLKEIARIYGVSYPTVRHRLDRLIDKIDVADKLTEADEFERTLRLALADGRLDTATFKALQAAHQRSLEDSP